MSEPTRLTPDLSMPPRDGLNPEAVAPEIEDASPSEPETDPDSPGGAKGKPLKERLEEQIRQKKARLARIHQKEATARRRVETRRKIIAGGMVLAVIEEADNAELRRMVKALLRQRLKRPEDRKTMGEEWLTSA